VLWLLEGVDNKILSEVQEEEEEEEVGVVEGEVGGCHQDFNFTMDDEEMGRNKHRKEKTDFHGGCCLYYFFKIGYFIIFALNCFPFMLD